MNIPNQRLNQQIAFIAELDRLKQVLRQTALLDGSRRENSAEHTWHIAMMTIVLSEYAAVACDLPHALKMLLIHDIVEIDAGDTFAFDPQANSTKAEREQAAAQRIFGLLPVDQAHELHELWEEFEAGVTAEARFANAMDRVSGLLSNFYNQGGTWRRNTIPRAAFLKRMEPIRTGTPEIWPLVIHILDTLQIVD